MAIFSLNRIKCFPEEKPVTENLNYTEIMPPPIEVSSVKLPPIKSPAFQAFRNEHYGDLQLGYQRVLHTGSGSKFFTDHPL